MTRYLSIRCLHQPFDDGQDENGRVVFKFNVRAEKAPSDTFVDELLALLVNANVGVVGTDMFESSAFAIPKTGRYLTIIETGGLPDDETQNDIATPAYERPGAQITVRAATKPAAWAMVRAAHKALGRVRNVNVTPLP